MTPTTPTPTRRRLSSLSAGHLATLLLISVTAVWGSTFFLIRDLVVHVPSADFLAVRFAIAAAVMFAVFRRHTLALSRADVVTGVVLGGILTERPSCCRPWVSSTPMPRCPASSRGPTSS